MPTHPFAIKCADLLEKLKRARDAMRKSKESAEDELPRAVEPKKQRRGRQVNLGAIAASSMERQAFTEDGGALGQSDPNDPAGAELRKLLIKLAQEESKCARKRAAANAKSGRAVTIICPGVIAARDRLEAYYRRRRSR